MKSANTAVLAITQTFTAHSGRNTTRRRGSIFSQRGGSERLKDERQPPGRLFFLLAAKERTKENCRCFDAADPRLRGCTPLRTPKRKSEGAGAKRKQYYFSFLTPPPLPPSLSRVLRGCERGATVERSETGERAMFAPAGQTTARACLRSKLAALVVRRQAPPNPRCRKQQSVGAGHARPAALPLPPLYLLHRREGS